MKQSTAAEETPRVSMLRSPLRRTEEHPRAKDLEDFNQTADDCLHHYNSTHPGDQYEPVCLGDGSSPASQNCSFLEVASKDRFSEAKLMSTRPAPPPCSSGSWDPRTMPIDDPLDHLLPDVFELFYSRAPAWGQSEQLAMDRQLVMDCLRHYNSMRLGVEYEPAPGKVTQHCQGGKGTYWTHGNFVARRKCSGWFSFLPAPRTLFFFELAFEDGSDQVVTCTPLLDEPVTEAYSVLGCPLWWSTRRSGSCDSICKTCKRRLDKGILACGHKERERLCKMCYFRSDVLHPSAGGFVFGNEEY